MGSRPPLHTNPSDFFFQKGPQKIYIAATALNEEKCPCCPVPALARGHEDHELPALAPCCENRQRHRPLLHRLAPLEERLHRLAEERDNASTRQRDNVTTPPEERDNASRVRKS